MPENWDTYAAPAPNSRSIEVASEVLLSMEDLGIEPTGLRASAEGGIGIYFMTGERYSHLESLNSGELVVLMYDGTGIPEVIEIFDKAGLKAALKKLREYNTL